MSETPVKDFNTEQGPAHWMLPDFRTLPSHELVHCSLWAFQILPRPWVPKIQKKQSSHCLSAEAPVPVHMLARVFFFHIGSEVSAGSSGKSDELSASGGIDFSIPAGSFPWTGHWDIGPF
ncbi:unnamed protein product [Effrenium voratum]|uniref:Uncharacterized protein n=1 Tax=Effrenium voratum TaxID=2562239 RepID=A0AA36NHL2_9DINO|nr:unnamed protein product [Effrenium voratum]